jgi:hypothetical protein
MIGARAATAQSADTTAKVTGGGTVLAAPTYPTTVASFGINARRPPGFVSGGDAVGRINYNRHRNSAGRHVNVPVKFMQAFGSPTGPNQTGGSATISGDCDAPGATCPPGNHSALVYVEDNSDQGAGTDVFRIFFCQGPPFLPGAGFNGITPPLDCSAPEGGNLRSGNIQVRGDAGVIGEQMSTAGAAGVFPASASFNGVQLAGGVYGVGIRTASGSAFGDLQAEYTGISLLGLYQIITVTGWITGVTITGDTATLTGTATLDMGDGPPPTGGLPLTGTLTSSGLTLTVGGSTIPTLPKTDGFTTME